MTQAKTLTIGETELAYHYTEGKAPGVVWLGGYRSDMDGTKAIMLEDVCRREGIEYLRFDYSGHGLSGGDFLEGSISLWAEQSRAMIEALTDGPQVLVGSSMGAWIALLLVKAMNAGATKDPIAGLLLLAPAPDFTTRLMEPELTESQKADLNEKGFYEEPTPYGPEPNRFTKKLFDDGRAHQVMTGSIDTYCPVHIIQGQQDPDVPWRHAQELFELLSKDDAALAYVKDGDHRLSRPEDLAMIERAAIDLVARVNASR